MSQRIALQEMDGALHQAMLDVGLAELGAYLPPNSIPGTAATPCRVTVDRGTQVLGEFGQVIARRDEIEFLLEDIIPPPTSKGTVLVGGINYMLTDKVSEDESKSRWVVRRV